MLSMEQEDIELVAESALNWDKLKNKTLLVSGGTGFIGSFLIDVISYRNRVHGDNINVIVLSRRGGKDVGRIKYIAQDISVPFTINEHVDYVLHMASNTHPRQFRESPVETIITNVYGCDNMLRIAKANNARFLLTSSGEAYGNGASAPIKEDFCGYIDSNTARAGYNESKRVCESLCQSYRAQYGLETVAVRISRVFGADKKEDSKAIAQFLYRALNGEDVVLNSAGKQRFSFCYIVDVATGLLKVLTDGADGEVYNIAADDDGDTLGGYASYIAGLAGRKAIVAIEYDAGASKADYAVLDCSKLKSLGWSPRFEVKEALKRTYEILRLRMKGENAG